MEESVRPLGSPDRPTQVSKPFGGERRACTRYPLGMELRYNVAGWPGPLATGLGRIVDFSSSGLRFLADKPLQSGTRIELSVDWPPVLDGGVRLQLVVSGTVVRTRGTETAVQLLHHEFRTRGAGQKLARAHHASGGAAENRQLSLRPAE